MRFYHLKKPGVSIFPIFDIIDVFVFAPRLSNLPFHHGLSGTKFWYNFLLNTKTPQVQVRQGICEKKIASNNFPIFRMHVNFHIILNKQNLQNKVRCADALFCHFMIRRFVTLRTRGNGRYFKGLSLYFLIKVQDFLYWTNHLLKE
jgi:hypothetical protein